MDIKTDSNNFISRHSLRLAGAFNLIGDALFIAEGGQKKDNYKKAGGALYTLGGLNLSTYGDIGKKTHINLLEEKLANFVDKELGGLPVDSELHKIKNYHNLSGVKLQDRLHQKPAQNTLAAYTAGAIPMAISGVKTYNKGEGWGSMAYGISSLALKTASWFIPENNIHNDSEKQGGIIGWVKEKPLRLMGYGSLISDAWIGMSAYEQHKQGKGYILTALTSGSYIIADLFMASSHKDIANTAEKLTNSEQKKIEQLVAEVIEKIPDEKKENAIAKMASFLESQPSINGDAQQIIASITTDNAQTSADNNIIAANWAGKISEPMINTSIA